ncbi:MAG: Cyclic di-GMP phosphodiesterase response regulator RpfG [Syntrophorhabdaceae bacterium PtaU1.Bin034]|nr:MAG: Cyclic di-GMP phosphodiesterase response regulator RpfG [Syntrophorhabdaceae bacterium PtaU1.Bin034]
MRLEQTFLSPLFLLLSDKAELAEIADNLDRGADDYVERASCVHILLPKVRSLIRTRVLQEDLREEKRRLAEANELLERNFKELTNILLKILEVRIPGTSDRSETAKAIADFVTDKLGIPEERRKIIVFSALFHEIGKIGLPDEVLTKHARPLPPDLVHTLQQHPTVGSMIVSTITGYKESAEIIYHQLENYDGSGFPDGLMGEEIPVGARILRAIVFQEELQTEGRSVTSIVERVRLSINTILDQRIANLLIEFLLRENRKADINKVKLRVDELKPGMVVADDVHAASGIKLLPKGVQLQQKMLELLLERNETDPIIGGVYVLTDWSLLDGC